MKSRFVVLVVFTSTVIVGATQANAQTDPIYPQCNAKCKAKREYRKARQSTPREPLPYYVTSCESGGNLHAINEGGSGAGGRYQIMPSTWEANLPSKRFVRVAHGDKGPRWSGRLLQDKVADTIRKDQGLSPWSCA